MIILASLKLDSEDVIRRLDRNWGFDEFVVDSSYADFILVSLPTDTHLTSKKILDAFSNTHVEY